jgi:hypothetical protein
LGCRLAALLPWTLSTPSADMTPRSGRPIRRLACARRRRARMAIRTTMIATTMTAATIIRIVVVLMKLPPVPSGGAWSRRQAVNDPACPSRKGPCLSTHLPSVIAHTQLLQQVETYPLWPGSTAVRDGDRSPSLPATLLLCGTAGLMPHTMMSVRAPDGGLSETRNVPAGRAGDIGVGRWPGDGGSGILGRDELAP